MGVPARISLRAALWRRDLQAGPYYHRAAERDVRRLLGYSGRGLGGLRLDEEEAADIDLAKFDVADGAALDDLARGREGRPGAQHARSGQPAHVLHPAGVVVPGLSVG